MSGSMTANRWLALLIGATTLPLAASLWADDTGTSAEYAGVQPATSAGEHAIEGASLVSLRLAGSALRPRENDVSYSVNSSGGCSYATVGDSATVWNTAITELPQGARIDTLRMYYDDTSASNSTAWLTVYDLYGNIVDEYSVSSAGNFGNSFNDSAAINHVVDYSVYSYLLNWRPVVLGASMQLCGFRVFYAR